MNNPLHPVRPSDFIIHNSSFRIFPVRLSELFHSIQGEGKLVGVPSVFVRASGCNLRCVWCDTPYASWNPEGDDVPVDEIVRRVDEHGARHVVLTGGEPMIFPDVVNLCTALKSRGHHVTIETAATVYKDVAIDLASLSPKLSNSTPHDREGGRFGIAHEKSRLNVSVIQKFIDTSPDFQLKFVVSSERDLAEIEDLLKQLHGWSPADVLLMPEGTTRATLASRAGWISDVCKRTGFRYCPRLHVELYGNKRGT
jgi:7-carboxy-7-deazaguanine synthase